MGAKKTTASTKKKTGKKAKKKTSASLKSNDGRLNQRIPINLLVDYRSEGNYLFDFCRDLGTGGVFIQTNQPLPKGSSIDLTFTIPDSKETLRTKGEVIWVQDEIDGRDDLYPGMGVQFDSFQSSDRKVLEDFVSRYHGDKFTPGSKQSA